MAPSDAELTDAKVAAAEARTDAKLAGLGGRLDLIASKLDDIRAGLRASFWGLATLIVAALAIAVAVMGYGGQWFGLGLQSHDALVAAAKEGAAQALAAAHR